MKAIKNMEELHNAEKEYECGPIEAIYNLLYDFFSLEFPEEYVESILSKYSEDDLIDTFNHYYGNWEDQEYYQGR